MEQKREREQLQDTLRQLQLSFKEQRRAEQAAEAAKAAAAGKWK